MSVGFDPASLVGTLRGLGLIPPEQAAQEDFHARTQQALAEASQAAGQYQQAASAPPPELSPLAAFIPSLLSNFASVIGGTGSYRENRQADQQQQRRALMESRAQNLQQLRDLSLRKAEAAEKIGDMEMAQKERLRAETQSKTWQVVMDGLNHQQSMEELRIREAGLDRRNTQDNAARAGSENRAVGRENRLIDAGKRNAINTLTDNIRQDQDIKQFIPVRDALQRVKVARELRNGQGDMALLFAYVKALDPESVVREGEYATAENTTSVPETARRIYNKAVSGAKLTDGQRSQYVTVVRRMYDAKEKNYRRAVALYTRQAKAFDVDPADVLRDYTSPDEGDSTKAGDDPGGIR